ncbi:FAD-dependent oxidoreductase [Paraburkholderia unamae]|uniref:Rubredoxin-NAD+ reductase n=1 Tax=Paraburkholderia unamae TaxID=219649 RepID=A0ABX5KNB0_9BURK|nr:FAD-dependent oxidoreductase [Paraburkholderia unamae]PVX82434.1 rubredoxin-NAD+ reductase [Paraburkholderia unamae]
MSDSTGAPIIIVGSGIAGYTIARELRKRNAAVSIAMVTADDGCFYSKPALSNALAARKSIEELATCDASTMGSQLGMTIITHRKVEAIFPESHEILVDGHRLRYSSLVLALGADARRIQLTGDATEDVLSVNDLRDYESFRRRIDGAKSIAVLGAGLIGCEFANDLSIAGYDVTLIDPAAAPLSRLLPESAGDALALALMKHRIQVLMNTSVQAVNRYGEGFRLCFADGASVDVDLVMSAVGLIPRTALAFSAGLEVEVGIRTDACCRTSSGDIYALGDCAAVNGKVQPYVLPIMHSARALAQTLCGEVTSVTFPVMPVTIKTPALPTVVVSPEGAGVWRYESDVPNAEGGFMALCEDPGTSRALGFALLGGDPAGKATLLKALSQGKF